MKCGEFPECCGISRRWSWGCFHLDGNKLFRARLHQEVDLITGGGTPVPERAGISLQAPVFSGLGNDGILPDCAPVSASHDFLP